jgi:hypothetical protein
LLLLCSPYVCCKISEVPYQYVLWSACCACNITFTVTALVRNNPISGYWTCLQKPIHEGWKGSNFIRFIIVHSPRRSQNAL